VSDVAEDVSLENRGLDLSKKIYAILDGAHRYTALLELTEEYNSNNSKTGINWNELLIPCNYISNMPNEDRLKYAFGNFIV
jgi:hypothetical protein